MPTKTVSKASPIAKKENPRIMLSLFLKDFSELLITRIYI